MKKMLVAASAALAAALAVSGCSSSASGGSSGGSPGTGASAASSSGAGYPVTVATDFGKVTVKKKPTRVVALGWGDAEIALELGVQPVGASDWLGFGGNGVGPWDASKYTKKPTIIGTLKPNYEKIAALHPDLILDVRSSGEKSRYQKLSSIAPTIGIPKGGQNYLATTKQQTTMIAEALGEKAKGKALLNQVADDFAQVAAAHPRWKGKSVTVATRTSQGWGAYTEGDARVDFFTRLGFVQSPKIAKLKPNSTGFSVSISDEQLNLLDADLIVAFPIFIPSKKISGNAQWQAIPAVKAKRDLIVDGTLSLAYSDGTPGAEEYALKKLVPLLEKLPLTG